MAVRSWCSGLNHLTTTWRQDEVDLYEINEAFAVVTMLASRELGLDPDKINVNGGPCALGHPSGAPEHGVW